MCAARRKVVGVDRNEREEALARGLAARVHELAERSACGERTCARRVHLAGAVIRMPEDDVALRDAETVADRVERLTRVDEQISRAPVSSDRGLDHREQDEALRTAEHVARGFAVLARLDEHFPRPCVLTEQVVDLAEHDERLGEATIVFELFEARDRERNLETALRRRAHVALEMSE